MAGKKKYYWRVAILDKDGGEEIAEATLRSPEGEYEHVPDYPASYVMLDNVYTAPKYRGQGLAQAMIKQVLERARRDGLYVFCRPYPHGRGKMTPKALEEFYRGLGFTDDPHAQLTGDWLVWDADFRRLGYPG